MRDMTITIKHTGKARVFGLEQPENDFHAGARWLLKPDATQELLEAQQRYGEVVIVLRVRGHNYWSGRGEQSYAGISFNVWRIDRIVSANDSETVVKATRLIDFDQRPVKS